MILINKFHQPVIKEKKVINLEKIFKLNKKNIILPLGSCFLDEFCVHLEKNKYNICSDRTQHKIIKADRKSKEKTFQFFFGNFYNPLNLLNNLERIVNKTWKFKDKDYVFSKEFNHYINLYLKTRFKTKKLNELKKHIKKIDNYLLNEIKNSSIILLSFDSAEVWVDKSSKKAWYTFYGNFFNQKVYKNRAALVSLNSENIKVILSKIIKILNKFGKKKFILMGSPHPLISSYRKLDHQLSNWYDKSNFISAYNDLKNKDTAYFPINEILHNYKENEIYEENFFYLKPKTKFKILLPKFKKMFF